MLDCVVISDTHLGSPACRADLLHGFLLGLAQDPPRRLVVNGDLFDSFDGRLRKRHWHALGVLRKLSDRVPVAWVRGNHDDPAAAAVVAPLLGVSLHEHHYVLESGGRKVLFVHGDEWDDVLTDHPWLSHAADWVYAGIQRLDPSCRLARAVKARSKAFLRCREKVRDGALAAMRRFRCDAVCVGHTHHPEAAGPYYNSGSWCDLPPTYLEVADGHVRLRSLP